MPKVTIELDEKDFKRLTKVAQEVAETFLSTPEGAEIFERLRGLVEERDDKRRTRRKRAPRKARASSSPDVN